MSQTKQTTLSELLAAHPRAVAAINERFKFMPDTLGKFDDRDATDKVRLYAALLRLGSPYLDSIETLLGLIESKAAAEAPLSDAEIEGMKWTWAGTCVGPINFTTFHAHDCENAANAVESHNADLDAARLAVAAARKERDEAIKLAYHYPPSEPYNPDGVTWRQMYEILDEKSLGEKHGHACAVATLAEERAALQRAIDEAYAAVRFLSDGTAHTVTKILRPHATRREEPKATAEQAKPAPVAENATPARQWSSTPPSDRSGKWWHAHGGAGVKLLELVPDTLPWPFALLKSRDYNLWLPYLDGDTRDTLPPLPNHSETPKSSPVPTRELVARLAEAIRPTLYTSGGPPLWDALDAIIRDAKGGAE